MIVNRVRLAEPLPEQVLARAREELPARAAAIAGMRSLHVVPVGADELLVVLAGDDEQAIDRLREEVGNDFMRRHVIPHAAGPPERSGGEAAVDWFRG